MDTDDQEEREDLSPPAPRTEGVRIIGADEAAAALEAGQAAGRRPEDAPRFGDVPEAPTGGPTPAARFPLPDAVDPAQVLRPPLAGGAGTAGTAGGAGMSGTAGGAAGAPGGASPEMPHWTEPATGEVPAVLASSDEDDMAAWSGFAGGGARWREDSRDWDDAGLEEADLDDGGLGGGLGVDEDAEDYDYGYEDEEAEDEVVPAAPARGRRPWTRISSRPSASRARRGGRGAAEDGEEGFLVDEEPEEWGDEDELGETQTLAPPRGRIRVGTGRRAVALGSSSAGPSDAGRGTGGGVGVPGGGRGLGASAGAGGVGARVATGLGIGLLLLLLAQLGPEPLLALVTLAALIASAEGFAALRQGGYRPATLLGLTASVSVMVGAYVKGETALPLVAVLTVVFGLIWYLAGVVRARPMVNVGATIGMFMWVGFLASYAGLLLDPTQFPNRHGVAFLMAAVIAAVGYDVGGFAFGRQLGRRPLAPTISPNKTWEGLVGGMLTCLVVCAVVVSQISPWDLRDAIALGVVAAVVAPLGDLCQSMIKRDLAVKDMGSILPGHGGFLDRIDAILFVLPATYYLVRVLGIG